MGATPKGENLLSSGSKFSLLRVAPRGSKFFSLRVARDEEDGKYVHVRVISLGGVSSLP